MPRTTTTKKRKTNPRTSKSKRTNARRHRRFLGLRLHHAGGLALIILGVIWGVFMLVTQPSRPGTAASCTVSDKLVNSCRPWLSATVGGYSMVSGNDQFAFFNKRLNNPNALHNPNAATTLTYKMDIPHVYHQPGQTLFSGSAQRIVNDSNLYSTPGNPVLVNWKPGSNRWADTAAGNSDGMIVESARAVKALGSRKIFLTLWHEPENDNVSDAGVNITGNCKRPNGSNGSAADYRAMWRHVREVFDREGVKNVVWFWNPMGYVGNNAWDCIVKPLYPGNDLVDWIMWDPYASQNGDFVGSVSKFYNWLLQNGDNGQYNFASKPWGLAEFGSNADPNVTVSYWQKAKEAIQSNRFPKIKLYSVFDTASNGGVNGGLRVGYNNQGGIDATEQAAFNDFARTVLTYGQGGSGGGGGGGGGSTPTPPAPTKDTTPPVVGLAEPPNGSTQSGVITVKGTASDNVKVTAVTLRVDDKWVATDGSAPYEFRLDTRKYKDGQHTIVLRAWDPTDNVAQSQTFTITFKNGNGSGDYTPPPPTSVVITPGTTSPTPIKAPSVIIVSPSTGGDSIKVWLDNKPLPNNIIDTTSLTNGIHTIKIEENGVITTQQVRVENPRLIALVNEVRANAALYITILVAIFVVLFAWVGRSYVTGLISRREARITKAQRRIK